MPVTVPVASDHPGSLVRAAHRRSPAARSSSSRSTDEHRRGALSEADGHTFAEAAEHAAAAPGSRCSALIASSGADVHDGVAALHGWGTAARALAALLRPRPRAARRDRPGRVRARRCCSAWPTTW